ncbi:hypothetical protein FGO68_gene9637 [Halteria grandinella]|uniref:Uncharacterized protein n=1 Tax=Halteria grandinella TaxID=5974 RepID=A0A8J8NI01_HALGN|nr:hypothetical protein FGO68_gene9637 [Halteria grandinella]
MLQIQNLINQYIINQLLFKQCIQKSHPTIFQGTNLQSLIGYLPLRYNLYNKFKKPSFSQPISLFYLYVLPLDPQAKQVQYSHEVDLPLWFKSYLMCG